MHFDALGQPYEREPITRSDFYFGVSHGFLLAGVSLIAVAIGTYIALLAA